MPRSRMVKPEFWDDEKLATISRDARLCFIGLWTYSDDYGVVKGHAGWLKNKIFPYEEIKPAEFQKWMKELENLRCILPFEDNNEKYYYIRTFTNHQTINRPSAQRNPEPPCNILEDSLSIHGGLTDETETETETETEEKGKPKSQKTSTPKKDFIELLKENPAYKHIDIDIELAKMDAWLALPKNKDRKRTSQFVLRWLNKIDIGNGTQPEKAHVMDKIEMAARGLI
jgi:hypothetical protein